MNDNKLFERIEKRVRKDIRARNLISKKKEIKLLNDSSKEFEVSKLILKDVFGEHLKIIEVKKIDKETLIPTNLDREIKKGLKTYFENENKKNDKGQVILQNVLEDEIIKLCKIKGIKIKKVEADNPFIESIEKKHPSTKFALAKSFERIL